MRASFDLLRTSTDTTERNPLPYLAAQAACAAFAVAMLYALGNATFILELGAEKLPYAFFWSCAATVPLSLLFNRIQRRWSVARLSAVTILTFVVLHPVAWAFARGARVDIAAYLLLVGNALALAFLVTVVTMQANRLYTQAQMKTQFPLVLAVQTVALIVCGLSIGPLRSALGGEQPLLLVGAVAMAAMFAALVLTSRAFPDLSDLPLDPETKPARLEDVLGQRVPRLVFTYQFLSSTGTLMVLYLVPLAAERVLDTSDELLRFFGQLIAGATLGALLFLVLASARVLLRGIGFALMLNPVSVIVIVAIMLVCNLLFPERVVLLLALAATARGLDFILSVGTTETSVNTFIKQLPEPTQLSLLAGVNAVASPLSYAAAGALGLAIQRWADSSLSVLLVVTLGVCVLWTHVAFRLVPEVVVVEPADTSLIRR